MLKKAFAVFLLLSAPVIAQQLLTNDSITKMAKAGLGDDIIVSTINSQSGTYATSVNDLILLKQAGLSDRVVGAMIVKNGALSVSCSAPSSLPATEQATSGSAPSTGPVAEANGKPRVFLQSASKGNNQNAARDQSMEMSKDFERDCPGVRISLNQTAADYTISLNHIEVGFIRDNQFQIADRNGDLISRTKEGGSIAGGVKKACALVISDWANKPH